MKRSHRLTPAARIGQVRQQGRSTPHPLVVLVTAPARKRATTPPHTRHAFAVGKRLGKANIRNLVKRRLREAVRVRESLIVPGFDLLWIARDPIVSADFWAIDGAVSQLLRRAKLAQGGDEARMTGIAARPHGPARPALKPGSIAATKRAASKAASAKSKKPRKAAQRPITGPKRDQKAHSS